MTNTGSQNDTHTYIYISISTHTHTHIYIYIYIYLSLAGDVAPSATLGNHDNPSCTPSDEYEFHGGSQAVQRRAVVSTTDVTFNYTMNLQFQVGGGWGRVW
jgi:hypothetical protein